MSRLFLRIKMLKSRRHEIFHQISCALIGATRDGGEARRNQQRKQGDGEAHEI